ncbi:hypothetical protein [Streptomyces showdoensis]|uniref:LigA protein n=1 Tax=Streptomyces showdoensis TaxID=68268 RepID=A0A2P2GR97_STREW|nr:hypothetical protein [Streptomyces showdoensis]KKZ73379.1 LigA protein [Streptomyces showdoensis]
MTSPTLPAQAATAQAATVPAGPLRPVLRTLAIVACLPYIALKAVWVSGGRLGIPDGSVLLDHPTMMAVANGVSLLADAAVVLLALLLTRPWGLRVRAWLLAFPMWAATGLIAPIMTAYPAQLLVALLGGSGSGTAGPPREPFLDSWVFPVVYGGFIVQGLSLGTLFALYSRDRWGRVWSGRLGELPARAGGPGLRAAAVAGAVLALAPATLCFLWAGGLTGGLSTGLAASYDSDRAVVDAVRGTFLVLAALSVLLLVLRRPAGLRVRTAMGVAWVASGSAGCWGAYMTLVALMPATEAGKEPSGLMITAYAGEMITGFLLAGCLALVLGRRGASA